MEAGFCPGGKESAAPLVDTNVAVVDDVEGPRCVEQD